MSKHRDRGSYDLFGNPERGRFGDNESADSSRVTKSDLMDFDMMLHAETHPNNPSAGAVFISDTGDENKAVWIPKSLCQFEPKNQTAQGIRKNGQSVQLQLVTVTTQEWVAKDKGLV